MKVKYVQQGYEELERQLKEVFKERSNILHQLLKTSKELQGIKVNLQSLKNDEASTKSDMQKLLELGAKQREEMKSLQQAFQKQLQEATEKAEKQQATINFLKTEMERKSKMIRDLQNEIRTGLSYLGKAFYDISVNTYIKTQALKIHIRELLESEDIPTRMFSSRDITLLLSIKVDLNLVFYVFLDITLACKDKPAGFVADRLDNETGLNKSLKNKLLSGNKLCGIHAEESKKIQAQLKELRYGKKDLIFKAQQLTDLEQKLAVAKEVLEKAALDKESQLKALKDTVQLCLSSVLHNQPSPVNFIPSKPTEKLNPPATKGSRVPFQVTSSKEQEGGELVGQVWKAGQEQGIIGWTGPLPSTRLSNG
ncbi:hypothetical protein BTVI_39739 [Pitangus sulphuratus]|nr:hypothetical protein BTVI_39739 [Pitangus sulphuratus]